jgi:4-amino-4-deoxy-L-arabinose transferase-like glycosyltransferase
MEFFRRFSILLLILLISAVAVGLIGYSTPWGPWAGSDSAAYLATAQNVLSGIGFRVIQPSGEPAILMPPIYPLLLASIGRLGIELITAARGLNMLLFGLTVFSAGYSFYRFSHFRWLAVPVSVLCLLFPIMLKLFSGMMSEPLFLWLLVSELLLLLAYLEKGQRTWLVAAGATAGIAALVRFIGAALLPVGILAGLLFLNASWKRRLADTAIFTAVFGLPVIIWMVWLSAQPVASPIEMPQWTSFWAYLRPVRAGLVDVLWDWIPFQDILPTPHYRTRLLILVLCAGILFGLPALAGFQIYRKNLAAWRFDSDSRIYVLSVLHVVAYLVVFILIYLFRNPPQDIDERTLLPIFLHYWGCFFRLLLC